MLYGRAEEWRRIDRLLAGARSGRSGALVIRGEAGMGKTALLDHAAAAAEDMRVLRGVGIESEAELPFGGLHLLLHRFIDRLDALPEPQAAALRTAFGLTETPAHDRFLLGVATLSLLAELADDRPVLCLIDDAQWLDRGSVDALLFVSRRLHAESVAMVFAVRDDGERVPAPGIDDLRLGGLDRTTAADLLAARAAGLTGPIRDRVLAEAGGNPLALIELAAALTANRHGGRPMLDLGIGPLPVTGRVQEVFRRQIGDLPADTQLLLLVAAADDTADLEAVLRAGRLLCVPAEALEPAEQSRLVAVSDDAVTFRHPLIRSATYQGAPHSRRTAVHGALARAMTAEHMADRRAWHRAAASTGADEGAAGDLERAALRAEQRGGSAAVAAAFERAAQLSTDPVSKARRVVNATRAAYDAGLHDWAIRLADQAVSLIGEPGVIAEAAYVRAQVAFERASPAAAAALALDGALPIVDSDPEQAVTMLTEAVWIAWVGGDQELARRCAARLAEITLPAESGTRPVADGMIGFVRLLDGDVQWAVPAIAALVRAVRRGDVDGLTERTITGFMALLVADDDGAAALLESLLADLRMKGAGGWLPYAMEPLALAHCFTGSFLDANAVALEGVSLATDIGEQVQVIGLNAILAWLAGVFGDESRCSSLAGQVIEHAARHPTGAALASWALGLLDLADGRSDACLEHLDELHGGRPRHDYFVRAVPDYVEAAVRSGRPERARPHLTAFDRWAEYARHPFATALSLRCHALLGTGGDAAATFEAALRCHRTAGRSYDRARTQLVYGEWLRRQRRRSDARAQLTSALEVFARLGARRWAERARTELGVLGERPVARIHDADLLARLTAQELQVVRLAAAGMSNREIGAQLFLSPRTVGHHLYKAYPKIGVSKRAELGRLDI